MAPTAQRVTLIEPGSEQIGILLRSSLGPASSRAPMALIGLLPADDTGHNEAVGKPDGHMPTGHIVGKVARVTINDGARRMGR